ncbi:MAG: hypothetical protein ABI551_18010 [Polyangiaceae bacterium]
MTSRRLSLLLAVSIPTLLTMGALAGGCSSDDATSLPYFEGGVGEGGAFDSGANEAGNDGGGEVSTEAGTTDGGKSDASTDGGVADSGDGGPPAGGLVISQVQSRGSGGAGDERIELYNPTDASVTFDATWSLKTRAATATGCASATLTTLVTGAGQLIPSHKHALFAPTGFDQGTAVDGVSSGGASGNMSDGASVMLFHGATVSDAICFAADAASLTLLTTCVLPYTCEGTPATNPHDNSTGTNADKSLERKPGGAGGNGTDTNVSSADFAEQDTPVPHNIAAAAVP